MPMDWNRPELEKCNANYVPLTPVSFLKRAATFFANRIAVIDRDRQFTTPSSTRAAAGLHRL